MTLDWATFRIGREGPEAAFEAFACQLFERWVIRNHGADIDTYVLKGAGGDGGVEAFATLNDGSVSGLQAKWFPGNVGNSGIRQIRGSIATALNNHSTLREYVVALPQNLTKGVGKHNGKPKQGGVERWDNLVSHFARSDPSLRLIRWDEDALVQELAEQGNAELRALWFTGNLGPSSLLEAWERARLRLRDRYLPELHAASAIQKTLERDTYLKDAANWPSALVKVTQTFSDAQQSVSDFAAATATATSSQLQAAVTNAETRLGEWQNDIRGLLKQLRRGPFGAVPELRDDVPLHSLRWHLEDLTNRHLLYYKAQLCLDQVDAALDGFGRASAVATHLAEARGPRLIKGPYGCGKTHAGAATVEEHLELNLPALFLQLKGADPAAGLSPVMERALDLSGWPVGRVFDALEALTIQFESGLTEDSRPALFARALIVIDGVEESAGWEAWKAPLAELVQHARKHPRVHVAVSTRPETARRLDLPSEFVPFEAWEDGGVMLPELLQAYAARYAVGIGEVPWLGWAVRNPLTVRLLADEFRGRSISSDEGATANMLSLFKRKIARIEAEAQHKSPTGAWNENLGLVSCVLEELATLVLDPRARHVPEADIVAKVEPLDGEFSAARVRFVLEMLAEAGLAVRQFEPSRGLGPPMTLYGLAHRHISDYVLARRLADNTLAALRSGVAQFPAQLESGGSVAVLFAAMLAEEGRFVSDDLWETAPPESERLELAALALVTPAQAAKRRPQVRARLLRDAKTNREVMSQLVLSVARVPEHPLGPRLLDEALQSLPMADRDLLWSVPGGLDGKGTWSGAAPIDLNRVLPLSSTADAWDGLPLVLAWCCSTVDERLRSRCRQELAFWGGQSLDQMRELLAHVAQLDDLQVVEDVFVAAFGASLSATPDDPAHLELALLVDELVFVEKAKLPTTDVIVLEAARGIVERAAALHPEKLEEHLVRARPPYAARGELPALDLQESAGIPHYGGPIVTRDLNWYVADRAFGTFARPEWRLAQPTAPRLHPALEDAIVEGVLGAPADLVATLREKKQEQRLETEARDADHEVLTVQVRNVYEAEQAAAGEEATDEGFFAWVRALLPDRDPAPTPKYSQELSNLLASLEKRAGKSVSPNAARNGMLATIVREWGWSEEAFASGGWDDEASVDRAIVRQCPSASHGERSNVATFREKYVWLAVNVLAGDLATRLPVWDEEAGEWRLLTTLADVGNRMPDPLPRAPTDSGEHPELWVPEDVWPEPVENTTDLGQRATALFDSPLPDTARIVRCAAENWQDAGVVALSTFRRGLHSAVDQLLQVRAWLVPERSLQLLQRDLPFVGDRTEHGSVGFAETVYLSPAAHCWAPWVDWEGEVWAHTSFQEDGGFVDVVRHPLLAEGTARTEQESTVWMPAPMLRDALGVAAMRGGGDRRTYLDRTLTPVSVERSRLKGYSSHHHYLVAPWIEIERWATNNEMRLAWTVRLLREATPALWMDEESEAAPPPSLPNRWREVRWLVVWDPSTKRLDTKVLSDVLEPFNVGGSTAT